LIQSWFDPAGYLQAYPDVSAVLRHPGDEEALLYHFVNTGFYERRIYRPHLLRGFHADYYREQLPHELRELSDGELHAHWAYSGVFRGLAGSEATSAALDSPFQVFSIGRVGSHSIAGALAECGVSNLIHTHSDFEFSDAYRGCCLTFSQLMEVKSRIETRAPVFIISGVRDPVGWLLSMFARLTDRGESGLSDLSSERLRSQLRSQMSFMMNFFRNRLLSPFEVFSTSFDAKAGFGLYENGRNRLLIYRVDRLGEIGQDIGKLVGVPDLAIQPLNQSSGAIDNDLVDSMWAMLFDDGFGDKVLRSDYVRRFFASDEQSLIADQLRGRSLPTSLPAL